MNPDDGLIRRPDGTVDLDATYKTGTERSNRLVAETRARTDTTPMNLTDFLQDRLDEDEQAARAASADTCYFDLLGGSDAEAAFLDRWDPARVLADIAAKRAILALHEPGLELVGDDEEWTCVTCGWPTASPNGGCKTVLLLAQPYADRPDFDPSWRTDA